MKTNRCSNHGFCRGLFRAQVAGLLALSLQISILAQEPETVDPALSLTEATITDSSVAETTQPARVDVSDLVEAAPAPVVSAASAPNLPFYVPPVVAAYLPTVDTNASIGIQYPAGSPEFAYLVAGIRPPGGDPRLPPEIPAEPLVVSASPQPLVFYERPEAGSKALMMRTTIPDETSTWDQTHTFPPGALVRGASAGTIASPGGSLPRPRGVVSSRDAVTTANGKDVVRDFPPGARLRQSAPPEDGR